MSAGDRDTLAALLLDALKQQPDAVDGDLDLNVLADVLLASDWLAERDKRVMRELRTFLPEWGYPEYAVAAICLELKERVPESYDRTTEDTDAH